MSVSILMKTLLFWIIQGHHLCQNFFSFHPLGLPNTCGLVGLKHSLAAVDALVVQQLKEAGGIALGVTTVPELSMWWETSTNVYGTTNNPYDSRRMVGGSSGEKEIDNMF